MTDEEREAVKEKWVKGLRSGNYNQSKIYLRDAEDNFCVLGVLADTLDPDAWRYYEPGLGDTCRPHYRWHGESTTLYQAMHWAAHNQLVTLNDLGSKLKHIADTIEEIPTDLLFNGDFQA